jgi:hypothetical protein
VLEVRTFNTHDEFTRGRPNVRVGAATNPSRLGFSYDEENTTTASIVNPSVVEVSTAGFLP